MEIVTEPLGSDQFDTIMVGTSHDIGPAPPAIIAFLQNAMGSARRVASICIGAFTLAQAGLLDGRRATTHWLYGRELQSRFPKINVEVDRIFIADGPVWTSAGMTAGIDLALGLLERDVGPEAARVVLRRSPPPPPPPRGGVWFTTAAQGANHNIPPCWNSMRIGSCAGCARLCQTQSSRAAVGGAARRSVAPQPAPVQSRVSRRNRAIACEGDREPQARGRQARAGARAAPDRGDRDGNRLRRPGAHAPSIPTRFWANAAGDLQRVTPVRSS